MKHERDGNTTSVIICIATHNAQHFIARTLDSILSQTYVNFKCVISDDASSDNTIHICHEYKKSDPRIFVYSHKARLGWVENINRSFSYTKDVEYLMILSHDDVIDPAYLEKLIAELDTNPNASVAFSDMEAIYPDHLNRKPKLWMHDVVCGETHPRARARSVLENGRFWVPYRGVFRSSVYKKTGGLRKHWRGEFAADLPWSFKLAIQGECIRIPETLYTKYVTEGGLSSQWGKKNLLNWIAVYCSCFQEVFISKIPTAESFPLYCKITQSIFIKIQQSSKQHYIRTTRYFYTHARRILGQRLWRYLSKLKYVIKGRPLKPDGR